MSNPANTDTQNEQETGKQQSEPTFSDNVNNAVKSMTQDNTGTWQLPDGLSDEVKVAAMSEKRLRDTQASYTKSKQENKALKAEKSVLLKKAVENAKLDLTAEQTEELEDLKFSDPEAWRNKINAYENEAVTKQTSAVNEEVQKVSTSSLEQEELETRKQVLEEFLKSNTDFTLNDDVIANDIPPRITKKLENGDISFEQFLTECYEYVKTGKVIKQEEVLGQPNLGKIGGGGKPDKNAIKEDIVLSYKTETY